MDKSFLVREYIKNEKSIRDVAKEINKSKGTIEYWLKKYNLPTRDYKHKWTKRAIEKLREHSFGSENANWRGGISYKRKGRKQSKIYKDFRKSVFQRDEYCCVLCLWFSKIHSDERLEAHHIYKHCKYPHLEFEPSCAVTLCRECHKKIKNKEEQYEQLFSELLKNLYGGGWYEWN